MNESNDKVFNGFLHQEYSHIADAHFKTNESISAFFKHFLVIMSIPIAIIAYFFSAVKTEAFLTKTFLSLSPIIFSILFVISLIGFFVLLYVVNLRMDAILYARTINGIRKYFYDRAKIDINVKLRMRVLPQTTFEPRYHEKSYFWPVVVSFGLFNSLYLFLAISIYKFDELKEILATFDGIFLVKPLSQCYFWVLFFFMFHFLSFLGYSRYREYKYLKKQIIGVDIDGVLNKHKEHFCKLLNAKFNKDIKPKDIKHIPIHESELDVLKEEEDAVFNDPKYWIDMPIEDETPYNIKKLHNVFKFRIHIFTHRPWPRIEAVDKKEQLSNDWKLAFLQYEETCYEELLSSSQEPIKVFILKLDHFVNLILNKIIAQRTIINRITKLWLKKYGFKYNKLIIEKANEDSSQRSGRVYNRFQKSIKKHIRFFVEDDWEKAIKLAFICDTVFLIDHPYNSSPRIENLLPSNIIRVKDWNEIYRKIRFLS